MSELYERIKVLCKEKGVSIGRMEMDTGIDRKTVHRWRDDSVVPRQSSLQVVADYLGVTCAHLVYGTGQKLDFPHRLKQMRLERGLTQEQLATALGYSENSVYNWESGKTTPSKFVVEMLAHFFGVSYEAMRFGRGE